MAIPGLSQCLGKATKKGIQNKQQATSQPKKVRTLPPNFDAAAPIQPKHTATPNQMDMFESSAPTTGKGAEIIQKTNALPVPPSIVRGSNPAAPSFEGRSVTFNGTVNTNSVTYSAVDGQDVFKKGTLPLADPKKPVLR